MYPEFFGCKPLNAWVGFKRLLYSNTISIPVLVVLTWVYNFKKQV